jgi:hypothetical protein
VPSTAACQATRGVPPAAGIAIAATVSLPPAYKRSAALINTRSFEGNCQMIGYSSRGMVTLCRASPKCRAERLVHFGCAKSRATMRSNSGNDTRVCPRGTSYLSSVANSEA